MTTGALSRDLRIGLLGCGRIARRFHLPVLRSLEGVELFAVAELNAEARAACRALAPQVRVFPDYHDLLSECQLDAVVICLPPALHADAAIAAFKRRMHVYLEKPLATSLEEASRVATAWRAAGCAGMIGFNYRFHPRVVELRETLARGMLGEVLGMQMTFSASRSLPQWKQERRLGGGALLDLASHHLDLAQFLLDDEIASISAHVRGVRSEDDTALVACRMRSGVIFSTFVSLAGVEQDRIELMGSAGAVVFDRFRSSRLQFTRSARAFGRMARVREAAAAAGATPRVLHDRLMPPREPTFALALGAFVRALRDGTPPSPDLDDGVASLRAVLTAEESARAGRWMELAPLVASAG